MINEESNYHFGTHYSNTFLIRRSQLESFVAFVCHNIFLFFGSCADKIQYEKGRKRGSKIDFIVNGVAADIIEERKCSATDFCKKLHMHGDIIIFYSRKRDYW